MTTKKKELAKTTLIAFVCVGLIGLSIYAGAKAGEVVGKL